MMSDTTLQPFVANFAMVQSTLPLCLAFCRVSHTKLLRCRRFLNRLLGLPVARQNLLFSYFACTLTAEIRAAKAEGRYFEGVSDLSGSNITEILQPKVSTFSSVCTATDQIPRRV